MGALTHGGDVITRLPSTASQVNYDNSDSRLSATQVQDAIDTLANDSSTFVGTSAQWEALTTAQKKAYKYRLLTDDYTDTSIGNLNALTTTDKSSVVGAINELKSGLTNVSIGTFAAETGVTIVSSSLKKSVNTVTFIAVLQKVMVLNENNLMGILPVGFRPSNTIITMAYNDTKDCPIKMQLSSSSGGLYIKATSDTADAAAQNIFVYVTYVVN